MAVPGPSTHRLARFTIHLLGAAFLLLSLLAYQLLAYHRSSPVAAWASPSSAGGASITIDYPENGAICPPEITPPTFIWRDAGASTKSWRVDIAFADGSEPIHATSVGEPMRIGEIDPRCVSDTNKPPSLTPEQAAAHTWIPDAAIWATVKQHSVERPATIVISAA